MKKEDEFIAHACKPISNMGCLCIQVSEDGSNIRYQRYNNKPSRWQEIKYSRLGRPYFTEHGKRQYIDDFMKVY